MDKISLRDFVWKVNEEGLGYCILHYFQPHLIANLDVSDEFKEAWGCAYNDLLLIENELEKLEEEL